jgi:hypothetical protein
MSERHELYRSPNGDAWFLGREPMSGEAFVIHQPNAPSGGILSHIELGDFLHAGRGPEHQALLRLIATLVDVPPFAGGNSNDDEAPSTRDGAANDAAPPGIAEVKNDPFDG